MRIEYPLANVASKSAHQSQAQPLIRRRYALKKNRRIDGYTPPGMAASARAKVSKGAARGGNHEGGQGPLVWTSSKGATKVPSSVSLDTFDIYMDIFVVVWPPSKVSKTPKVAKAYGWTSSGSGWSRSWFLSGRFHSHPFSKLSLRGLMPSFS